MVYDVAGAGAGGFAGRGAGALFFECPSRHPGALNPAAGRAGAATALRRRRAAGGRGGGLGTAASAG